MLAKSLCKCALIITLCITLGSTGHTQENDKTTTVLQALKSGIAYLIKSQNKDGSWGSARQTKGLNIYAPAPGSHHAFRTAVTAICVSALIEVGDQGKEAAASLERGLVYLLQNHKRVKRASSDAIYNIWAHAYLTEAFARALIHEKNPEKQKLYRDACEYQIKMLERYQTVYGGWGYYDFGVGSKIPAGDSMSFATATGLYAMKLAQDAGLKLPEQTVERALRVLERSRRPDGSYVYSLPWGLFYLQHPVNNIKGSLARTQACNLALQVYNRRINIENLKKGFENFFTYYRFLDIARKRPVPHEAWYANSGYFFYYGYYYGAILLRYMPSQDQAEYARHLASGLIKLQEKNDGSWWDYPFYDYHKGYGTGFAVIALNLAIRAGGGD